MIFSIQRFAHAGLAALLLFCGGVASARNVSIPNTFTAQTTTAASVGVYFERLCFIAKM